MEKKLNIKTLNLKIQFNLKSSNANKENTQYIEKWQENYTKLAGNEIHSIVAENSKFFQEFIGKSFAEASFSAHKK